MDFLFEGLLPDKIRIAVSPINDCVDALLPEELPFIAKAVASRKNEFATGRRLARQLLAELDHPDFAILREEDRIPRWPEEIVGSITHSNGLCAVAVGRSADYRGIGIDLEPDEAVDSDIARVVCRDDAHDWVAAAGEAERGRRCRMVFSVKEAVYKAFYPRTREFWGFQDVGVSIDLSRGTYRARLPESAGRSEAQGRIHCRGGWIVSALALSPA